MFIFMKKKHSWIGIPIIFFVLIVIEFSFPYNAISKPSSGYRILITGFEPFGGFDSNPSEELVHFINSKFSNNSPNNFTIKGVILPVTYFESWKIFFRNINSFNPDFVISLGYAPGSNKIRIESTAKNKDRGSKDNKGVSHYGPIIPNGALTYNNALPIRNIQKALGENGIESYISNDAGGYLCNHIFYNLMHHGGIGPKMKAGFIHIPSWSVERLWKAIEIAIKVLINSSIKVGIFEFEPVKNDVNHNLLRIDKIVSDTIGNNIGFYIFPEMALSGLIVNSPEELLIKNPEYKNGKVIDNLKAIAIKYSVYLSIGLPEISEEGFFNSYQIFNPSGKLVLLYKKNHLYGADFSWAKKGNFGYPILETDFGKIGVLICHDVTYKESFKDYINHKINFLIIGTNWIGDRSIHYYLIRNDLNIRPIFISDRKGQEENLVFHGNTSVIDKLGVCGISRIVNKYNGIIYLHINE